MVKFIKIVCNYKAVFFIKGICPHKQIIGSKLCNAVP